MGFFTRKKDENKEIAGKLYEQNLELAIKNKTLSLLERLYHTSTLTLAPDEMAKAVADIIQRDFNLEFAGILSLEEKSDSLSFLSFCASDRLKEVLNREALSLDDIKIQGVSKNAFLMQAIKSPDHEATNKLENIFGSFVSEEKLFAMNKDSHIKTVLLAPLKIDGRAMGIILLGFNREYSALNSFEKESIKNFTNPIGLMLFKAYLYKRLQKAYVVEKKAKEELQELDKVKNAFMTQMQHDLRTPLTSIRGYTDLLLSGDYGKQSKKTIEVLKRLEGISSSMIKRANNFLELAQFQMGKSPINLQPDIPVFPMLKEITEELEFKASTKNIYLKLEKPKTEFLIKADREKLKASIFNVVDNAVKYTQKGGVDVKIGTQAPHSVLIAVTDTGIGINPEQMKHLFETMFSRSEEAKKTAAGFGVGLFLSTQIIQGHGGKVWAESNGEGKGSTFYIELPIITK